MVLRPEAAAEQDQFRRALENDAQHDRAIYTFHTNGG
jgi:hypothetical protein